MVQPSLNGQLQPTLTPTEYASIGLQMYANFTHTNSLA